MATVSVLDLALSIPAGRRLRARRTFALPIATENAARITWQVLGAITDEHVLFNGAQIAAGDQMTLPNVASAPLAERNRLEVSLSGEPGAAFRLVVTAESRVTALRADSPLYPGARVDLRLHFPELRFGSRMRFFLQPPPGVRGSATGAPIPVRRVDSHTGIVRLSLSPTIALGAIPLVVTFDGRAVAAGVATVQMPVPIGNALWSVADRSAAPPLATPAALARTANGQLFGAESGAHRIVRLKRNATVIVAGSGAAGYADGRVAVAQFNTPSGLATHDGSPIFVADTGNHCIRLIERGRVTTFAGAPEAGFADGDARTARFNRPQGLALGPDGALYVADTGNHALRRVDSTGQVSTLIGNGEPGNADGTAGKARLHSPVSLAFGPDGTIYLTDAHRLRALSPRGILRTLAGSANSGFAADVGRRARFANPTGVAWMDDHLVVADTGNGLLRTVDPQTGATLVLAGGGTTVAETAGVVDGATAQLAAPTGIVALPEDGCLFAEGTSGQVCTLRPSRRLSVRLLNPPLTDFATGDRSLTLLLQTNRPDVAVAIGHRFDDGFVAQATGRSGADGLFSTGILLFSDAENRLEVRVRDGRAALRLALTIRQTSAALPVITAPIIGAALTLPNGLCRADVGPARTGAAICVAAGIVAPLTRGVASAQGSFSAALAAATLQGVGGEIVPLPVDLVSFAAQDGAPRLVQSQPLLVRTPASPPMVSILSPVAGEPLVANRVDVLVRADRAIAAGDVNGVPIGADGIAPNVPLTAAETVLSATVRDFRGLVGQASLTVQLAEGVPTKQLAAIQIATAAPAQGAPLTLTGANIGAAVSAIFISTNAGLTPVLFSVDGSDQISLTLPETAANGQIVVYAGDDAEIVPLNVRWEGTAPGAASDLLALSAPALGAPTGAAAYDAEEVSVRIDWRANAPVAAMNRLIEEFGFRLVGAVRYGEEADAQPLWSLSTWFGAPADKYTDALAQLPPEQVYAAQLDVPEPGGQPHTVGFPTTTPAGVLRWGWDKLASAAQTGFPAVPGTWQLQTTRIPAAWNVKVQGLNQPVSAMVVDAAAVALPGHEDVRLTGAPGFEVAQNIHHGVWVASILGSGHNGAQGGVTRAGIDGANPLQDVNKAGAQLTIYAANTAPNFSNWKPVGDTLLKKAAGKYTLPAVRVMNCSFGSGLPRRTTHWYFNANLATVAECAEYFAPYALVAAKTAVANSPANQQALTSALLKPYISPNPPSNDRWQSEHDFFAALGNVIATMAKIVKAADIQALVQRLTTDLAGYVVANPAHQATPPEQNPFVQRQLEKATIKFINAGIPKALLDRDILLVNSGGNEGNLLQPGTLDAYLDPRPENWIWWGPGYRPPSEYCSTPGYFRFLAGGRGPTQDPANSAPIQNIAAAAANIILVGGMEAISAALKIWSGSNSVDASGTRDGLFAPAAGLRAASGPNGAAYVNGIAGTSFAAPLVSGVASYLLALDPKRSEPNAAGQLRTALIDHSATQDGVRLLDAFATARNFLNPRHPDPKYTNFFDRAMCNVDDGTAHGNDSENSRVKGLKNAGEDVEWLPGDARLTVNMADFRSFRDAYVQIYFFQPDAAKADADRRYEHRIDYALRLRDLNASGAQPWTESANRTAAADLNLWPRFDFDGSGLLEQEQDVTLDPKLPPGSELALLASFWNEQGTAPLDYEWVKKDDLVALLLSCDLRIESAALDELRNLAPTATGATASLKATYELLRFVVKDDKGTLLCEREIPSADLDAFDQWATDKKLWLTLPITAATKSKQLANAKAPPHICVEGIAILAQTLLPGKSKAERMLEFVAEFPAAVAPKQDPKKAKCGQVTAMMGGRYPVVAFHFKQPAVQSANPASGSISALTAQGKVTLTGPATANFIPKPGWATMTVFDFEKASDGTVVLAGAAVMDDPDNTTQKVAIAPPALAPGQYKIVARREPKVDFDKDCLPTDKAPFEVVANPTQAQQPTASVDNVPVPGKNETAKIDLTLCLICPPKIITYPKPPLGNWYPMGGAPLGPNVGGGGAGSGPPNGVGGFPGPGFGSSWGSPAGTIPCYVSLLSLINYRDSDFALDATLAAPPGSALGGLAASIAPDAGLQVIATPGAGPVAGAALAAPSAAALAAPDTGEDFAPVQTLRFVVRGASEGLHKFTITVQGQVRPLDGAGPAVDFGPMDVDGEVLIIPVFFLVGISFPSDYLEESEPFDMIATVTNSPQATATAFETVMAVSGEGADVQNPRQDLGDLAPGDSAVAAFRLIARRTGPVTGVSQRTSGRVAVDVSVGGVAAQAPVYPIEGSPGLSYLLARYPELTKAVLALAGGGYGDALAQQNGDELRAAVALSLALHRAGFRLLAGDDDAAVIGELILATQGGADDNPDFDLFRRTTPPGARVREAANDALVQAAGYSQLPDATTLFHRLAEVMAGDRGVLWMANSADLRLALADDTGATLGEDGPAGITRTLPFAELYSVAWPAGPVPLAMRTRPPRAGTASAFPVTPAGISATLTVALPAPAGMLLARWEQVTIPAGGRATLAFDGEPLQTPAPRLLVTGGPEQLTLTPDFVELVADPAPRVLAATVVPPRQGGAPYRNLEVRYSELVDAAQAANPANYRIPGYTVLNAFWYPPTRAAFLFVDPPLVGQASVRVEDVADRNGQLVAPAEVAIAGTGRAARVVGRVLGADGQPFPAARLTLDGEGYQLRGGADAEGMFVFDKTPLGSFTVSAEDPSTGRRGGANGLLVFAGQEVAVEARLIGDGSVVGQVLGPDGAPAANALVTVIGPWPFEARARTDAGGFFRIDRTPLAAFSIDAADELGRTAHATGAQTEPDEVTALQLRLAELPPAQVQGLVSVAGDRPLPGAVVRLEGPTFAAQRRTDDRGQFEFGVVPAGDYTVSAQDAEQRRVEQQISASSGVSNVTLRLLPTGIVHLYASRVDGQPAPGARVAVQASGFYAESRADSDGLAIFNDVPAGAIEALAQAGSDFGSEILDLPAYRATTITVQMVTQGIRVPATLLDANRAEWVLGADGAIGAGTNAACSRLRVNGAFFEGAEEASVLTSGLEFGQQGVVDGLHLVRRVYVSPADGFFVRLIDTLTNPGETPRQVAVELAAEAQGYTRDGDEMPGRAVFSRSGAPALALVWSGAEQPAPLVTAQGATIAAAFAPFTLAPRASVSFLHFVACRPAPSHAAEAGAVLAAPPAAVLTGITREDAGRIVNFDLPLARGEASPDHPLFAFGRVESQALTADGFVIALAPTTIAVRSPLYDRTIEGAADSSGIAIAERLPTGEVTVTISHPATRAQGMVTARLEPGAVVSLDVKLENSGTVEGFVRRSDGAGAANCDVYVNGVRMGTSLAGRFRQRGIPLGPVRVQAQERQSGLIGVASGTLAENGATLALDVAFPPTGTVRGRLLAADGVTARANQPVILTVRQVENAGARGIDTDEQGRFFFPTIPAGAFSLTAQDSEGGGVAFADGGVVQDGETVTVDLLLGAVGLVTGRVTAWDALTPLPGVRVEIVAADGRRQQSVCDLLGRFAFAGVAAGAFDLTATALSGSRGFAAGALATDGSRTDVAILVDLTPPTVDIHEPAPGVRIDDVRTRIAVALADDESGIDLATLEIRLNGADVTGRFAAGEEALSADFMAGEILRLGDNQVEITVRDRGNNQRSVQHSSRVAAAVVAVVMTDNAGAPVSRGQVTVRDRLGIRTGLAGTDGRISLAVTPGLVQIEAVHAAYSPAQVGDYTLYPQVVDGETLAAPLVMQPAVRLVVRTLGADGRTALAGATVALLDGADRLLARHDSDEDGVVIFATAPVSTVQIALEGAGDPVAVLLGPPGETQEAVLTLAGPSVVIGQVRNSGGDPLVAATVRLRSQGYARQALTDASGMFRFAGLTPAALIELECQDSATGLGGSASGVAPHGGEVRTLSLTIEPSGEVAGQVVTHAGAPHRGATISLRIFNREERLTTSADDGSFAFRFVPLGAFTLVATTVEGDFGFLDGNLLSAGQTVAPTVTLAGLASLQVTVTDGGGVAVAGAQVRIRQITGQTLEATSDVVGAAFFPAVVAGQPAVDVYDPASRLQASAVAEAAPESAATVTVALPAVGAMRGRVLRADGLTPVAGAGVTLSVTFGLLASAVTGEDGGFRFDSLRIAASPFRLDVRLGARLLSTAADLRLTSHGQVLHPELRLPPLGRVRGRVLHPDGSLLANQRVTLLSSATTGGGSFSAVSDGQGSFSFGDVALGGYLLRAENVALGLAGEGSGQVQSDGQEVVGDLRLQSSSVALPYNLSDANQFVYAVQPTGTLVAPFLFQRAPELTLRREGVAYAFAGGNVGLRSADGRQVTLTQDGLAGLSVSRRIHVPADGFAARYVEFIANPGTEPVTIDVEVKVQPAFGNRSAYLLATSSGRALPEAGGPDGDRWLALATGYSGQMLVGALQPYLALVWDGADGGVHASRIVAGQSYAGDATIAWDALVVPPGGQIALLHYLAELPTPEGATAAAQRLSLLSPEGLDGLSADELAAVANWRLPAEGQSVLARLPSLRTRTVTGVCRSFDGQTPVPGCMVNLRTAAVVFARTTVTQSDANGRFSFSNQRLPDAPFQVEARRESEDFVLTTASDGDGALGSGQITLDLAFVEAGSVAGLVVDANGQPVTSATVRGAGNVNSGADGRFIAPVLPAGVYLLTARRILGTVAVETQAFATVTVGQTSAVTLAFPTLAMVIGRIVMADGSPAAGVYARLRPAAGGADAYAFADGDGRFAFEGVRPGSYALLVARSDTGQATLAFVTVAGGESTAIDLTLPGAASISGQVRTLGGLPVANATVALAPSGAGVPDLIASRNSEYTEYLSGPTASGELAPGIQPGEQSLYIQTDDNGSFSFDPAPIDSFTLVAANDTVQATTAGIVTQAGLATQVDVTLPALAQVTCTLLDNDAPAAYITVEVRTQASGRSFYGNTDENGVYLSPLLPLGAVTLLAYLSAGVQGAQGELSAEGQLLSLTPQPGRSGGVQGTVRDLDGLPLAGASVTALDRTTGATFYAQSDETGFYSVQVTDSGGGCAVVATLGDVAAPETSVTLIAEETVALDLIIPLQSVAVAVRTLDGDAPAAELAYAVVLRSAGRGSIYATQVAPGEFRAQLPVAAHTFIARVEVFATGLLAQSAGYLPEDGSPAAVTFVLPQFGMLQGQVVDDTGAPMSDVGIGVSMAGGSETPDAARSDEAGRFSLWPVAYGAFTLTITRSGGYTTCFAGELSEPVQALTLQLPAPATVVVEDAGATSAAAIQLFTADLDEAPRYGYSATGSHRFEGLPNGPFGLLQQAPSVAAGGVAQAGAEVTVVLPAVEAPGILYGFATGAGGLRLRESAIDLEIAGATPQRFYVRTGADGAYLLRAAPPGAVTALMRAGDGQQVVAAAAGVLLAGAALRLDLTAGEAVRSLPGVLGSATLNPGLVLLVDSEHSAGQLRVNGAPFPEMAIARGAAAGELAIGPAPVAGLRVERRLYSPADAPWLRFLEIVENPGPPTTFALDVTGSVAGAGYRTSSGASSPGPDDRWVVAVSASGPIGFVLGGFNAAVMPASVMFRVGERNFTPEPRCRFGWTAMIGAGQRMIFVHFLVYAAGLDTDSVAALAAQLAARSAPGMLDGLENDLLAALVNL